MAARLIEGAYTSRVVTDVFIGWIVGCKNAARKIVVARTTVADIQIAGRATRRAQDICAAALIEGASAAFVVTDLFVSGELFGCAVDGGGATDLQNHGGGSGELVSSGSVVTNIKAAFRLRG